ncbi:MAG TPA: TetR family transcriptional regulator [Actinomycetospora sp.]|uniref:TetR/AcrR family transcriptional regulator n=1 Tax=Actinomycetospora sp. TaxID=1872135 RepID=UPI002F3F23D3
MADPYRERAQQLMREAVLDAAAAEVVARGWRGLQMRSVADAAEVSRATLYKTFGDKHGLSKALVIFHTQRLLDQATEVMADQPLREQWRLAAATCLHAAEGDPLTKAVLLSDSSDEFLPLLTSRGAPVLDLARDRFSATVLGDHPGLDPDRVATIAENVTRLIISHLVLPRRPTDQTADTIADLATSYLQ